MQQQNLESANKRFKQAFEAGKNTASGWYRLEETPSFTAFTHGKIVASDPVSLREGERDFFSRYPKAGYMSVIGASFSKNGIWYSPTSRLTNCD